MAFARRERLKFKAAKLNCTEALKNKLLNIFPFNLTQAQKRVCFEISHDLAKNEPMLRLVQGDVGSGKTVIAMWAALHAIANGYQVAFMAPTDILTEQHVRTLKPWCEVLDIHLVKLTVN